MLHMWLMDLINVGFLVGATLFWWPMVGIDPIIHWKMGYPARMLNILLGSGVEAFLGVAILNSAKPLASMYTLGSTKAGGGLLWAATEVVTLGAFVPIFLQWMRSEERVAVRADERGGASMSIVSMPGDDVFGAGHGHAGHAGSFGATLANGPSGPNGPRGSERSGTQADSGVNALNGLADPGRSGTAGSPVTNGSKGSIGTRGAAVAPGARAAPLDTSKLTAWEYAWLVRTGSVPTRFVVPDHAPGPEDVDEGSS
jgi:hypothetical protein